MCKSLFFGVRSGETYECKVDGVCEDGTISSTLVQTVTLPSVDTSRQRNCGVLPPVDLSVTEPLEGVLPGDFFWAGDFPVQVTSSTGGDGIFSGEGNVVVPYLFFQRFAVRFNNVLINRDRRLVRGFVEAVYDDEKNIGNLDDVFEGGSSVGEVISGITYADIDVSFTLPEDGSYSYDSVSSQIHVYDGDDEVGVIDVGGILSSSGEGGSSVSGESVFPITVKDSAGNLYSLAPDPDAPSGSSGGVALKVRKVGSSGGSFPGGSIEYDRLDRDIGVVSFRDAEGSRYEFDGWHPSYGSALLIRDKYERLDQDYYVPCKLLPSGASDRVVAHLDVHGSGVDPAKVRFVTRGGTEYTPESFDGESGDYVLSLVGGRENDGQELYAVYPKSDGGYYNLGKLLVLSYPSYRFSVKVVSVGGGLPGGEYSVLSDYMKVFFSRYGIACDVSYDETDYSDLQLFDKGSGILSAYNSRMKSFQRDYASTHEIDASSSYLFIFPESGHKGKRDFSGFMPRGCQFGYVFRQDFREFDSFCLAVVHELCHGRFVLKHTFDSSYGLVKGSTDNLMDYTEGASHLAKWQWDLIHDPGVVVRIFERDKDAMKRVDLKIDRGDYNIGGHEDILFYLLSYKEDELVYNLQKYDYVAINSDEEKNKVAVLVIKNVLSGIEIGDEIEARILVEEFINNYSIRKIALLHEQIMEKIQNSETFPEIDIRNMINDAVLYTSIGTSLVDNFVKSYKEFWMSFKLINLFDIEEFRRYFLYDKSIVLSKQGISNLLQFVSNGKFKDIIRSKLPAITNNELRDMIKLKNNFSLQSSEKFTNIIKIWKPKDAEKIFYELDDLTLALLVGQESNFEVLNNTTSKNIWMKFSKLSENGTFEKIGATIGFISLLRKIEEDKMLAPADIVSVFPNTVSLFSFLIEWVVDDKLEEIGSFIFDEAPDWSMVKKWNVNFRGQLGFPDEPLYMYYTDEKGKVNPDKIPTSFIMTREIALKVFNFLPIVVDFDNKGTINFDQNKPYFLPTKQVYLR